MEITISGQIYADPISRILAIEACVRAISQRTGQDPAEGVMTLLTAAAHMYSVYSGKPLSSAAEGLAYSLGCATVAADDFFGIKMAKANDHG